MAKVQDTVENLKMCKCSTCWNNKKGDGEGLYCARGPSKEARDRKGCNCPECPVWLNSGIRNIYYCVE